MKRLRIGLLVLLPMVGAFPISDVTPPPFPPPAELVVTGKLTQIAHGAGCGYFSMGVVAEYGNLQILEGTYRDQRLFVVHGCPELSRPEFSASAGSLASLEIGAYHRLELLTKNFYQLELVYGEELKPVQLPLFYVSRADPADYPMYPDKRSVVDFPSWPGARGRNSGAFLKSSSMLPGKAGISLSSRSIRQAVAVGRRTPALQRTADAAR